MNNSKEIKSEKCALHHFLCTVRLFPFIIFFLWSNQNFAQEEVRPRNFSIHAGINSGILSGGYGPSFSFHYVIRTLKLGQIESMLLYDSHSGETFLSGQPQKDLGVGLAVGLRLPSHSSKNWDPSVYFMVGGIYNSRISYTEWKVFSPVACAGLSVSFNGKHMISMGANYGTFILAVYLKYGFWF